MSIDFGLWNPSDRLRGYQIENIQNIARIMGDGANRIVDVLPTGAGKSIIFREISGIAYQQGKKILITAHTNELVSQAKKHLLKAGMSQSEIGIIKSGFPLELGKPVQVASISTLINRDVDLSQFDCFIWDEAHHYVADQFGQVIRSTMNALHIGFTATPERADGKGLGDIFQQMVLGPSTMELIAAGHLNRYKIYGDDVRKNNGAVDVVNRSIVENWKQYAYGAHTVVFARDIDDAMTVADLYNQSGVSAVHISSRTPMDERRRRIRKFISGECPVITQVGIITEGFDLSTYAEIENLPDVAIKCVQFLRRMGMKDYLQACGRALRLQEGDSIILDHVGNAEENGMPDDPHVFSLEGIQKRTREQKEVQEAEETYNAQKKTFQISSGILVELHPSEGIYSLCASLIGVTKNTYEWHLKIKEWIEETNPSIEDLIRANNLYKIYGEKKTGPYVDWLQNGNKPRDLQHLKAIGKMMKCNYQWASYEWNNLLAKGIVQGEREKIRDTSYWVNKKKPVARIR